MPVQKNDSIYSASQLEIFSFIDALTPANRPPHNLSRPVFARHVGDRMYRGEYYAMQLDAHDAPARLRARARGDDALDRGAVGLGEPAPLALAERRAEPLERLADEPVERRERRHARDHDLAVEARCRGHRADERPAMSPPATLRV